MKVPRGDLMETATQRLSLCVLLTTAVAAQDAPIATKTITGIVQSEAGKPVSGADVILVGQSGDLATTKSAHDGSFTLTVASASQTEGMSVWAIPGGAMGWTSVQPENPVVVRLRKTADFTGRFVDDKGHAVSGVNVGVTHHTVSMGGTASAGLPSRIGDRWQVKTDNEGEFRLLGVPTWGALGGKIDAQGFGSSYLRFVLEQPLRARLSRTRTVSGRLQFPEGWTGSGAAGNLGKVSIYGLRRFDAAGKQTTNAARASHVLTCGVDAPIRSDGTIRVELSPGTYGVTPQFDAHVPLAVAKREPLIVAGDKPTEFVVGTVPAHRVQGRVISSRDSRPVAGAQLLIMTTYEGSRRSYSRPTTAKDGTYLVHVRKGRTRVTVISAAGHVASPRHGRSELSKVQYPIRDIAGPTQWPDIKVDPATDIVVQVVDEEGQTVPGAEVKVVAAAGAPADFYAKRVTDSEGKCVIAGADTTDTLPIWARTDDAVSAGSRVVTPGKIDGPIKVIVAPNNGVRFRCKVIDRDGKPIPNAEIRFRTTFRYVSKWVDERTGLSQGGSAGTARTDENGMALSGPLWSGQTYWIKAAADGYDLAEAPQLVGGNGVVDIKPFVLKKARATTIAGIVMDTDGNPLRDVRVFAAGKRGMPATTLTTRDGKFQLREIAPDVRYVFADGTGYRFGGVRVKSEQSVSITLRSVNSPPKGVRPVRPISRDQRVEATRKFIRQSLKVAMTPPHFVLNAMARIDRDQALFLANAGGQADFIVRRLSALQVARRDTDKAVELLRSSRTGFRDAVSIGLRFAKSKKPDDSETARKFAKLAQELVRKEGDPARSYPDLVRLLTWLGETEQAEKLIRESVRSAEAAGDTEGRDRLLIHATARALAPYDYDRAVKLCRRLQAIRVRTNALADVAVQIARSNPDKALADLDLLVGDSNTPDICDKAKARIAMLLVDEQPDRAIEIVRSCSEKDNRAQAIGWLCIPLSRQDKKKAWALIDEALAIHREPNAAFRGWGSAGGGGPHAARLAWQAQQAGYPDMESVIWHVRAACRAKGGLKGMQRLQATIKTAKFLALVDRLAARELLNLVSHQTDQLGRSDREWWQAWILTDFTHACSMIADRLSDDAKKGELSRSYELDLLMESDPEEQFRMIRDRLALWEL